MYEWLEFLGKISKKTNYDWYIKLHPDFLDGTKEIIDKFLKRYPSIIYIPNDYSHNQLLREGINVALTCFGSIAHEYPLLNKLVVNCSLNNPHINYNFSLHPKNIKNYKNILFKLHSVKNNVRKNELYEFYAMFNILRKGWLIDEYNSLVRSRGMNFIFLPDFYNYWIKKNFKVSKHEQILKKISKFIDSNDYLMDWNHKEINRRIF